MCREEVLKLSSMPATPPCYPAAACQCAGRRISGAANCGAHHFLADLTLPCGRVVYDYNKEADALPQAAE